MPKSKSKRQTVLLREKAARKMAGRKKVLVIEAGQARLQDDIAWQKLGPGQSGEALCIQFTNNYNGTVDIIDLDDQYFAFVGHSEGRNGSAVDISISEQTDNEDGGISRARWFAKSAIRADFDEWERVIRAAWVAQQITP